MPDLLALNGQIIGGVPLPAKNYVKLWENPDPTAAFTAQDITLSSDDYDFLLVICGMLSSSTQIGVSIIAPKGKDIYLEGSMPQTASGAKIFRRLMTRSSDTSFNISEARYSQGTSAWSQDDTALIPTAVYGIKKDALATEGGGVGGGHIIEDAEGTDLDQQDKLQFKGTLRATNDAQNGKTIIDDSAVEIEWDDWQAMTEAQREAYLEANPKVDILNFPDASGEIDVELFTKLWENPDPTQVFGAQNITLASGSYDFLVVLAYYSYTDTRLVPPIIIDRGSTGGYLIFADWSTNTLNSYRSVAFVDDTHISINNANRNGNITNSQLIPYQIYGFKKKVTVGIDAIAENVSTSASKCMLSDGETSVEDAITWKLAGSGTSVSVDSIIDNAREFLILASYTSNWNYTFSIPQIILTETKRFFDGYGYQSNTNLCALVFTKSTNTFTLSEMKVDNTDRTSVSTLNVYYR